MSNDTPSGPGRALVTRLRQALESPEMDGEARDLSLRILSRTERVVGHLEVAAETLEAVAKLELRLLRKMVPIVEDLGELLRHTLDDARERRGLSERGTRPTEVIDVEAQGD